jgi:hypothetical protein
MDRLTIRLLAIAVALTAVGASLVAQAAPETQGGFLGVRIAPAFGVPVGNDPVEIIDGGGSPVPVDLYGPGGQVGIALHLNAAGIIQPTINGRFNLIPVGVDSVDGVELGVAAGGAGALFNLPLGPRFRLLAFGEGGYFLGSVEGNSGSNPYYAGGGGLGFRFARSLQLNLEANYAQYFDLYSGLGVGISLLVGGGGAPDDENSPRARPPPRSADSPGAVPGRPRVGRVDNRPPRLPGRTDGHLSGAFPLLQRDAHRNGGDHQRDDRRSEGHHRCVQRSRVYGGTAGVRRGRFPRSRRAAGGGDLRPLYRQRSGPDRGLHGDGDAYV